MLIADTQMLRVTVDTNARVVLEPTSMDCERKVHVHVAGEDFVYLGLDVEPSDIGPNRTYKLAPVSGGQPLVFRLKPHQRLIGAAHQGLVTFTIVVEHREAH